MRLLYPPHYVASVSWLSNRQREILTLVTKGLRNREIGLQLGLSEGGVKYHINRLFVLFGVTNRTELVGQLRGQDSPEMSAPEAKARGLRGAAEGR